jgi:putative intracellular protease/amidase
MSQKKVLIVVSNHGQLGNTGKPTGWYLPEVAHPYHVFTEKGHSVDFVSPQGGAAPVDPGSVEIFKDDPVCQNFLKNPVFKSLENTPSPSQVNPNNYNVIFCAGGHGPMFDFPENEGLNKLIATVYEAGGIVGAVCHGTVGLVNVKLSNGDYLVKGKKVAGFTNDEEDQIGLSQVVPFLLETRLEERGAIFTKAANWAPHVANDQRVISGQNPASATLVAEEIAKAL